MATVAKKRKLTVYVAPEVAQAVRAMAARTDRSVSGVIEDALIDYLGRKALDEAQAVSGYAEEEAMAIANEELHAMRRERGPDDLTLEEKLKFARESAGAWKDRDFDGAEYVERIRGPGLDHRLKQLGL